jgi:hypothetical protein
MDVWFVLHNFDTIFLPSSGWFGKKPHQRDPHPTFGVKTTAFNQNLNWRKAFALEEELGADKSHLSNDTNLFDASALPQCLRRHRCRRPIMFCCGLHHYSG